MPDKKKSVETIIYQKLREAFSPQYLEIINESDLHEGHIGNPSPTGETHFKIIIRSQAFKDLSRVAQHQKIYTVLKEEMAGPVHALSLQISS